MNIFRKLHRKFILEPAGFGRPIPPEVLDREYRSGAWAHFHQLPELPRQSVVVGYVSQLYPTPSILDIGCGSGRLAQLFQPHPFRRYLGVDVSSEGIRMARSLGLARTEFLEGNFETWRPTESFDVIMFIECIGYAHDPGALVANFIPRLAPGGMFVISHFRFGRWTAHWERITHHLTPFEETTVANAAGQIWDIRLLRPRT